MELEQLKNIQLPDSMPILVAVVAATIQMIKGLPLVDKFKAYLPLLSTALGVLLAYYVKADAWPIVGFMIGLTACGAYDFLKGKKNGNGTITS